MKENLYKLDYTKIKNFCSLESITMRLKRQATKQERLSWYIYLTEDLPEYIKNAYKSIRKSKKKTHKKTVESGQETRTDTSQKRTPKWANKHMKNSHYHYSSGECRL